jgi:hypothetical protein
MEGRNDPSANYTCNEVNEIAELLSNLLVKTAKHYQNKEVEYGEEKMDDCNHYGCCYYYYYSHLAQEILFERK